jgi:hypothetical protein
MEEKGRLTGGVTKVEMDRWDDGEGGGEDLEKGLQWIGHIQEACIAFICSRLFLASSEKKEAFWPSRLCMKKKYKILSRAPYFWLY